MPAIRPAAIHRHPGNCCAWGWHRGARARFLVARRGELSVFEIDVFRLVNDLPALIYVPVWAVMQLGSGIAIAVLAGAFLARPPTTGDRPSWCFSVGGIDPRGPVPRRMTELEIRPVEQRFPSSFLPRDHRLFGGVTETVGSRCGAASSGGRWAAVQATTRTGRRGTAEAQVLLRLGWAPISAPRCRRPVAVR